MNPREQMISRLWAIRGTPQAPALPSEARNGPLLADPQGVLYSRLVTTGAGGNEELNTILADSDGLPATIQSLPVVNWPYMWSGTLWNRQRQATAANLNDLTGNEGGLMISREGNWSITHTPAADTQATISRAATPGLLHVVTSISFSLVAIDAAAAEANVLVNLRDSTTGAGNIIWSQRAYAISGTVEAGAVAKTVFGLSGLSIRGVLNQAVTLEFAAAGGANTFETVALTGYTTL